MLDCLHYWIMTATGCDFTSARATLALLKSDHRIENVRLIEVGDHDRLTPFLWELAYDAGLRSVTTTVTKLVVPDLHARNTNSGIERCRRILFGVEEGRPVPRTEDNDKAVQDKQLDPNDRPNSLKTVIDMEFDGRDESIDWVQRSISAIHKLPNPCPKCESPFFRQDHEQPHPHPHIHSF